jgi:hypothetical protein|nr:MAG TPA: hypothetical protein [Caudoviricetes sp.]
MSTATACQLRQIGGQDDPAALPFRIAPASSAPPFRKVLRWIFWLFLAVLDEFFFDF